MHSILTFIQGLDLSNTTKWLLVEEVIDTMRGMDVPFDHTGVKGWDKWKQEIKKEWETNWDLDAAFSAVSSRLY
jgi:hypothetical protein